MARQKRHSKVEIATKLAQANDLASQGKVQSEIARTLGVSVMTLHRWRKAPPTPQPTHEADQPNRTRSGDDRIAELQFENSRLRRLVTDLLLRRLSSKKLPREKNFRRDRTKTGIPIEDQLSFSKNSIRPGFASCSASWPKRHHRTPARWRQELASTIAQCLNLEHEINNPASKPRILGFEPLD